LLFLQDIMKKFLDNHVKLYEKWILNTSLRMTGFLDKGKDFDSYKREILAARPFVNYRLLDYLKATEYKGSFFDFNNEYRRRHKYYE